MFPTPAERAFFYYGIDNVILGSFLIVIGLISLLTGVIFYIMLYSPEVIRGLKAEYKISPDLTSFQIKPYKGITQPIKTPEEGYCTACGKHIFKPYLCNRCGQILCGTHVLPGNHKCRE